MVRNYPAHFLYVVRLRSLLLACVFLVPAGCLASDNAVPGFLEGRLRILAFKDVELAEGTPAKVQRRKLRRISADHLEPGRQKRNCACNGRRKWKLSSRTATWRLHSRCARTPA